MGASSTSGAAGAEPAEPAEFTDEDGCQYRAGDELGRGVLTAVYRAATVGRGEGEVAIKTVLPLWIGHPLAEARIAREREVSQALHGDAAAPRCARVVASGRQPCAGDRSRPFHVSACLRGATLAERLRDASRPPSVREALAWTEDVLVALERVHAAGWVHRDVKPQNVFLVSGSGGSTTDSAAWLIDFGLALPIGAPRGDGDEAFGTPAYVSPEVIAGAPVDPRADLYSVGLMLFELLAGRRPFSSRDPVALLDAHLSEPPPRLRRVQPARSETLDRILWATLGKDPGERPGSAAELRSLLRDVPEAAQEDCAPRERA